MSTWLFDLGNTRLKFAPLHDGAVGDPVAIDHDGVAFHDGWESALPARIGRACVASVAGAGLTEVLLQTLGRRCDEAVLARTRRSCDGVRIAYADPARLGVDRFLALLAAHARGAQSWLVVGIGTALTIDLVDGDGRHRGGRIAPSPALMRAALHARAPHLPLAGGAYAEFADDTADALVSGCDGAALALVGRSIDSAAALLGRSPGVLLHGGGATALLSRLDAAQLAPALVLEGLARWAAAVDGDA